MQQVSLFERLFIQQAETAIKPLKKGGYIIARYKPNHTTMTITRYNGERYCNKVVLALSLVKVRPGAIEFDDALKYHWHQLEGQVMSLLTFSKQSYYWSTQGLVELVDESVLDV